jgi:hypothetical protein
MDFYKGNIPIIDTEGPATDLSHPVGVEYGYVERDYRQYPESMFSPPSEMELIPPSEWDARFDEQEATKSSLEHIYLSGPNGEPAFDALDQNGNGYCHTADTEVLTDRGFVAWPDYNGMDLLGTVNPATHAMEFQAPLERHVYEYDGPMIYSTNGRLDFGVTPDHQMYVRKWDERARTLSSHYSFVRAADIGWYAGALASPSGFIGTDLVEVEVPGDRRYDGDDFLAMLSLICSDGYAGSETSEKGSGYVGFCCFREDRYEMVSALANRIGFKEQPSRKGVWIRYSAHALAEWVRSNCYTSRDLKAPNKKIPDLVKCASMRQIKLFITFFGDQKHGEPQMRQFYSASKRMIDDLQELHLRIGKRSTIGKRGPTSHMMPQGKICESKESFILTVSSTDRLCIERKKHIETEPYKGQVYCAAVPNHTLITRRNGSVLISSNCWSYSTGTSIMLDRLRRGLPLIRLNPHGPAAIIKKGRDEGGWCGLSGEFGRDVGYPVEGTGPGQWPLHSRNLKYDTPQCRAEMAKYRVQEDFVDLTRQVYDRNLTEQQVATSGFNNIPGPRDYNHWSHSVAGVRWVRVERGSWGQLILNSWGKGWGRFGLAVLVGSKRICNGGLGIRLSSG